MIFIVPFTTLEPTQLYLFQVEPKNSITTIISIKIVHKILYVLAVCQPKTNERIFDWSEVEAHCLLLASRVPQLT